MKKILVLTDFSNNAHNAAEAAVILPGKIHANLLIMNSDNTEIVRWDKVQREQMEKLIAYIQYFADLNIGTREQNKDLRSLDERAVVGDLPSSCCSSKLQLQKAK